MSEDEFEMPEPGPDRRSVMKAAALVVVPVAGIGALAACGSGSSSGGSHSGSGGSGSGNGTVAVASSSVPVGGGFVDKSNNVVVTQPEAGVYKAFTAICTHQGCIVNSVADGTIDCPCHGSKFSIKDGSVVNGPATSPLTPVAIKVAGTSIVPG